MHATSLPSPSRLKLPVTDHVTLIQTLMVNLFTVAHPDGSWSLVDAGMPGFTHRITSTASQLFGSAPPVSIILTHGHIDHIGSLHSLLRHYPNTPVYAHELELPYLTARASYPPADPTVGGGIMPRTAIAFPRGPFDFRPNIRPLPTDGSIPTMPGWRWIHTPGHTPGHISLYHDADRTLLAGDAFITQKQESLLSVLTNSYYLQGPPSYFTTDWLASEQSVRTLRDLHPNHAATGHGLPLHGEHLRNELDRLVNHFQELSVPPKGRYVPQPARANRNGPTYIPPKPFDPFPYVLGGIVLLTTTALVSAKISHND